MYLNQDKCNNKTINEIDAIKNYLQFLRDIKMNSHL